MYMSNWGVFDKKSKDGFLKTNICLQSFGSARWGYIPNAWKNGHLESVISVYSMLSVIVTSTTLWCAIHYLFLLYARPGTHIHLTLHMHSNLVWQNHAILYCNIIGEILHLLSDVYIQNGLDSFCHIPQEDDIWVSILWAGTKITKPLKRTIETKVLGLV